MIIIVTLEKQNLKENTNIFKRELKKLRKDLDINIPIDHVGSTTLPYMYGKNIIDILIGARNIEEMNYITSIIKKYNYYPGNSQNNEYRFFASRKEETKSGDIHVHLAIIDSKRYKDFLLLKEYLLNNKEERRLYSNYKKQILKSGISKRNDYKIIKSQYITDLLNRINNKQ